ncbi:hypothetical protein SAMN05660226_00949 [Parapedobacter luteus]|uniref:Uncharacterized protein n=1 Tax=Parapedobacter luteus TaxID=623280 RepID=A0A1T5APL9_9SPHI|nr:hypothetical protein SAMN05660226_00949 [Parapedobacter luteus]
MHVVLFNQSDRRDGDLSIETLGGRFVYRYDPYSSAQGGIDVYSGFFMEWGRRGSRPVDLSNS